MTNEVERVASEPANAHTEDTPLTSDMAIHSLPDHVLGRLVAITNRLGGEALETGITLHVSGMVVSGILISGRAYFETLITTLKSKGTSNDPKMIDALAKMFAHDAESYREDEITPDNESSIELEVPKFVHLKYSQIILPDGSFPKTLWRGRLSHVSGWSLGHLA